MGWLKARLGDHVDLLTGYPFKSAKFIAGSSGIRLLKGSVVSPANLDWTNAVGWPVKEREVYRKFELSIGDVVLAMDRPWIESGLKYAWVKPHDVPCLLVQRVARMRGANGLDTTFLRYLIGSSDFVDYIVPMVTGVNVPHISPDQIRSFRFMMPPIPTQQKIAAILSAYDDLIDNNNRRIKTLEEMARRIYNEWFVAYRYPERNGSSLTESAAGLIPDEWKASSLSQISLMITRGISPRYSADSTSVVINQKCIRRGRLSLEPARKHNTSFGRDKLVRAGDVLINSTGEGTLGRVAQVLNDLDDVTVDSHVTIVRPATDVIHLHYFGFTLLSHEGTFASMAQGSTGQTELGRSSVGNLVVPLPPMSLQRQFSWRVSALRKLALRLQEANELLAQARDLLLPRLISGELDVTDLDIAMPPAAA